MIRISAAHERWRERGRENQREAFFDPDLVRASLSLLGGISSKAWSAFEPPPDFRPTQPMICQSVVGQVGQGL